MTVSLDSVDCVNIHSLGHPLVFKIFAYLQYEDMKRFIEAFPNYLDDEYSKILFTHNGQPIVAWEKTGKAFLLRLIPRRKYEFLLRRAALKFEKEKVLALLRRKVNPEALVIPLKRHLRLGNFEAAQWFSRICPGLAGVKIDCRTAEFRPDVRLLKAVEIGNLKAVKALLIDGVDLETKNDKGETALFKAVSSGKIDVANYLIKEGADVNIKDKNGRSVFQEANFEIAKLLIETGLFVNADGNNEGLLIQENAVDEARLLIDAGADQFEMNCEDATAAKIAAAEDSAGLTRMLIEAGSSKALPFTCAALHGNVNTVRELLAAGVDPNIKDNYGCTALMDATSGNHMETVKLLLDAGADPNLTDLTGQTALFHAFSDIVQDPYDIVNLLIRLGADIHVRDKRGYSALTLALKRCQKQTARLLINAGATINMRDKFVKGLLKGMMAGDEEVFDLILMVDSNKKTRREPNVSETALLVDSIRSGNFDTVKKLIKDGCDLNTKPQDCRSIIREAVGSGQTEIVRLLLGAGVEPVEDSTGPSLFELAFSQGYYEIAKLLVEAGAHAYISSNKGDL